MITLEEKKVSVNCYHCGEDCQDEILKWSDKSFCCQGCLTVYEILSSKDLCEYYALNNQPGNSQKKPSYQNFQVLDNEENAINFIKFKNEKQYHVVFNIPSIHCSSCIWLLEKLPELHAGIISSRINFVKKEITLIINNETSLSKVAKILAQLSYAPRLSLNDINGTASKESYFDKKYFYKLGIAFFCFGNIMLLSFPEYFGIASTIDFSSTSIFNYLNIALSLPVLFYSASEFFKSAINGLKVKNLNMDFPIALGIAVMFFRSLYEIFSETGSGYLDTMAGLVFLMLVGRALQNLSFGKLAFEHDYKSYFPLSVSVLVNNEETSILSNQVKPGDRLIIRNHEIIPADAILIEGVAGIDYSFVTGESQPVFKKSGELIYAGGRQTGEHITVEVIKEVSQSYLTKLWNDDNMNNTHPEKDKISSLSNKISNHFSIIILLIAASSFAYWATSDISKAIHAFTSVLIITCPCALALSSPFTLSNFLTRFGRLRFYLKKPLVIEQLAEIDTIIFDKTGTLTQSETTQITYFGVELSEFELKLLRSICKNSGHPLSRTIYKKLTQTTFQLENYLEVPNQGLSATYQNNSIRIGSLTFINPSKKNKKKGSILAIEINKIYKGYFLFEQTYRDQLPKIAEQLNKNYSIEVLSGDNDSEKERLLQIFGKNTLLHFNQTPFDKQNRIKYLQNEGKKVLMVGDGLNDAGALLQSNAGIAITENTNNFSPACDGILHVSSFSLLPKFLKLAHSGYRIIILSFLLSFIYNIIGLYFAVQGNLSPLVAAILMPISSISIILFTTLSTAFIFQRNTVNQPFSKTDQNHF